MKRLAAIGAALYRTVRRYPALSSGIVSAAVALLARLGFHVTADQLVAIVAPLAALLAAAVHATVTPTVKHDEAAKPAAPVEDGRAPASP